MNRNEDTLFINRIKDLAKISYSQNRYTFSNFLNIEEQTLLDMNKSEFDYCPYEFWGGHESCERRLIRFGSAETLGYDEAFPIKALRVEPLMAKFSDELTHRDFLGALMNLGINRNVVGDIILKNGKAYIFCLEDISEYIIKELTRVKHTSVSAVLMEGEIAELERKLEAREILVSSPRLDAIVAAICKLSRGKAIELFREKKVLVNSKTCENNSMTLKEGCTFTIRGYGKFIYDGEGGRTRKDRVFVKLRQYV